MIPLRATRDETCGLNIFRISDREAAERYGEGMVEPKDESVVAAVTDYHQPFCSVIARDNLYATQFHPE